MAQYNIETISSCSCSSPSCSEYCCCMLVYRSVVCKVVKPKVKDWSMLGLPFLSAAVAKHALIMASVPQVGFRLWGRFVFTSERINTSDDQHTSPEDGMLTF